MINNNEIYYNISVHDQKPGGKFAKGIKVRVENWNMGTRTYVEYGWLVRKKKNIGKVGVEKLDEYQRTGLED